MHLKLGIVPKGLKNKTQAQSCKSSNKQAQTQIDKLMKYSNELMLKVKEKNKKLSRAL